MKRSEIPRDSGAVVGCYSMDLYCCHPNHVTDEAARHVCVGGPGDVSDYPETYTGETRGECLRAARRRGWWFSGEGGGGERAVLCPYHAREVRR